MIQGFTEPIPVSSSGHLLIFQKLIGSTNIDYQTLSIITNFGSLIAIVIIFSVVATELPPYFCTIISPIIFPP